MSIIKPQITVEPFAPTHLEGFARLFDDCSSSCFCRYWHFPGTKNEWLERTAFHPDENLAEQTRALHDSSDDARGLIALASSAHAHNSSNEAAMATKTVVGWLKVAPRDALPKLTRLPVYRHVPFEPKTWSLGCFLVHPNFRRRGVAKALVRAAITHMPTWGAEVLEAYPRRSSAQLHDEEAWQGPEALFVELGFSAVHDVAPYPVYRIYHAGNVVKGCT